MIFGNWETIDFSAALSRIFKHLADAFQTGEWVTPVICGEGASATECEDYGEEDDSGRQDWESWDDEASDEDRQSNGGRGSNRSDRDHDDNGS